MMTILVMAAQPVIVPVMTPIPSPTPASLTRPIEQYVCRLIGEAGSPLPLVVRREGHQGFVDETTLPGKPFASRTEITFRVIEDGTGLLHAMNFQGLGSPRRVGHTFRDDNGNIAVFNSDLWPSDKTNKAILSMYFYAKGTDEPKIFAGPCKVTRIEQAPLDHDPKKGTQ